MPLFGAHMSIAGGHFHAIEKAQPYRCEAVQLFTKSTNQWQAKDLSDEEVALFRKKYSESRLQMAMGHDSYLINLASPDEALYRKSIESFILEYQRSERLGLDYLITHPGSHVDSGEEAGLARIALPSLCRRLFARHRARISSHHARVRSDRGHQTIARLSFERQPKTARQPSRSSCSHRTGLLGSGTISISGERSALRATSHGFRNAQRRTGRPRHGPRQSESAPWTGPSRVSGRKTPCGKTHPAPAVNHLLPILHQMLNSSTSGTDRETANASSLN